MARSSSPRPVGLEPPPKRAPARLRSTDDLRTLQRLMAHVLVRPLTSGDDLQPRWLDGRPLANVVAEFIKPNDRLTSLERLQIYSRSYWYRLIDCVYDDSPGLRALLGEKKFSALVRAYLAKYPSRSFTLRNLCSRLPQFIREEPRWTVPRTALAHAVARFEWAQTVGFDAESRRVITTDEIADAPPARLRLGLQPYLTLLALGWPVDDYVIAVKQHDALRHEASNAVDHGPRAATRKKVSVPRRRRVFVVVHRYNQKLYYKRVEAPAFKILVALHAGRTLVQAIAAGGRGVTQEQVREWFTTWSELGWFCRRQVASVPTAALKLLPKRGHACARDERICDTRVRPGRGRELSLRGESGHGSIGIGKVVATCEVKVKLMIAAETNLKDLAAGYADGAASVGAQPDEVEVQIASGMETGLVSSRGKSEK